MEEVAEEEESAYERYSRMSRHQKLALLMIALGKDASATLLKRFDVKDAESICKEIGNFPIVDQEMKDCVLDEFSEIIESSVVGVRKPEPRFYEIACERLGVDPSECVFLDDLGINLKPARTMGMQTIKVVDPDVALAELETIVGISLR